MTRDMELVRRILLAIADKKDLTPSQIKISGQDELIVSRHLEMLHKQGYLEGPRPIRSGRDDTVTVFVRDLSWSGNDLLTVLKNESVWNKLKQSFSPEQLAGLPLETVKEIGKGLLTAWATKLVGLGP